MGSAEDRSLVIDWRIVPELYRSVLIHSAQSGQHHAQQQGPPEGQAHKGPILGTRSPRQGEWRDAIQRCQSYDKSSRQG